MHENRLFTRYRVPGEVLLQVGSQAVRTELVDMSFRGFGVYSPKPVEADKTVKFFISGSVFTKHLRGDGRVMYCQPYRGRDKELYRIGVEFVSVDSDQVRDVIDVLQAQKAASVEPSGERDKQI